MSDTELSRRQLIVRGAGLAASAAGVSSIVAACGGDDSGSAARSRATATTPDDPAKITGTATLLTYPKWYASGLVEQFGQKYPNASVKVVNSSYSSLSAVAQRVIRDSGSYDLVLSGSQTPLLEKADVLAARSQYEALVPNLSKIDPFYREKFPWGVPLEGSVLGLAYNQENVSGEFATWGDVWNAAPKYRDRIIMIGVAEDALSIALLYLGHQLDGTLDEDKISKAADALIELKPYIQAFKETGLSQTLVDGSADMVIGAFNSETAAAQLKKPDIKYVNPEDGVPGFLEGWVLTKDADLEVAAALTNEQLDPKTYARFVTENNQSWLMSAAEEHLTPDRVENKATFKIPSQYVPLYVSDPKINALYNKYWQKVRAA